MASESERTLAVRSASRGLADPRRWGTLLLGLLIVSLLAASPCPLAQDEDAPAEEQALLPFLTTPLPDPFIFREGNQWYLFGTAPYFFQGDSLLHGEMRRVALEFDFGPDVPHIQIWGFRPYKHTDGSFHVYGTLHYGYYKTVVAHFLPAEGERWDDDSPITRWRLDKVLVGDVAAGDHHAYDSNLIRDTDGALYLLYNQGASQHADISIFAQRMLSPGEVDTNSPPRAILSPSGFRSEDRNPGYKQLVESTHVTRVGDTYVLLYSVGDYTQANYKVGVAYSDCLIPPEGKTYQKVVVPDPDNVWGHADRREEILYLLQSEKPNWPNYSGRLVTGPGIGNIHFEDGRYWLIFHGYRPDDTHRDPNLRQVYRLPLRVSISPERPMREWLEVEMSVPDSEPSGE